MAATIFQNIEITGLACAVPTHKEITSSYVNKFSEDEVRKFIAMVGVKERYVSGEKQTGSDLCFVAAQHLISKKDIEVTSIDAIIYMSQIPDYKQPSTAYALHKRLHLKQDCLAFDINLGCTGFIYGVAVMASLIASGLIERGLLMVGEVSKADKDTADHTNAMMFGDAGSACIIERGAQKIRTLLKSDGNGFHIMGIPGGQARHPLNRNNPDWESLEPHMDGFETFRFAITKVPAIWKEFSKIYRETFENYDYVIFHQSNRFMIEHIAGKLKLSKGKYPLSIDRYGNTNGVSIPITIVDLLSNQNMPEDIRLVCIAFGVGLSWGIISFSLNKKNILPMIYSDEYDEEAYTITFGKRKEG